MINRIFSADFDVAIIASAFLGLILTLNIIGGKAALRIVFAGLIRSTSDTVPFRLFFFDRYVSSMRIYLDSFMVNYGPTALNFGDLLFVFLSIAAHVFELMLSFCRVICQGFCEQSRLIRLVISVLACLAMRIESIAPALVARKMLRRSRLVCLAFRALFHYQRFWSIMRAHQKLAFLVSNPGALARRCPVLLLGSTPDIISQIGAMAQ